MKRTHGYFILWENVARCCFRLGANFIPKSSICIFPPLVNKEIAGYPRKIAWYPAIYGLLLYFMFPYTSVA